MINTNLYGIYDNHFCFEFVDISDVNNITKSWYIADVAGGTISENQLQYTFLEDTRPVKILAETDNEFLVVRQIREVPFSRQRADGTSETTNIMAPQYAFIDKESYWTCVENYTDVNDTVLSE